VAALFAVFALSALAVLTVAFRSAFTAFTVTGLAALPVTVLTLTFTGLTRFLTTLRVLALVSTFPSHGAFGMLTGTLTALGGEGRIVRYGGIPTRFAAAGSEAQRQDESDHDRKPTAL
jgi:hypothetical protein